MVDEYIIVMEVLDKQLQVVEDPVKVAMNLRNTTGGAVYDKTTESEEFPVHDNAGHCSDKIPGVPANEKILEDEIVSTIHQTENAKPDAFTPMGKHAMNILEEPEEKVESPREQPFVFPTFNLNISQECPTPRIYDDGDDVIILHSVPPQTEKASIKVKKELFEAWELNRGLMPRFFFGRAYCHRYEYFEE